MAQKNGCDEKIQSISIELIDCDETFSVKELEKLTYSIREKGVLEPLILRIVETKGRYEIIAGKKRFQAAKKLNLKEVPAILKSLSNIEAAEMALESNLRILKVVKDAEISSLDRGIVFQKKDDGTYKIINGRHKFLVAKEAGLEKILVTIMPDNEKVFINLID